MAEPLLRPCSCVTTFGHALPSCGQCHGSGEVEIPAVAPPPPMPSSARVLERASLKKPAAQTPAIVAVARPKLSTSPRTRHISVRRCDRCAAFIRKERFDEHVRWEHTIAPLRVYAVRYKAPPNLVPAAPASARAGHPPRDPDRTLADHHGGIRDPKAKFASDPSRDDFGDESDA